MKSYSFIKPELKPFLSLFSKIWILLICISAFFLILVSFLINYSTYSFKKLSEDKQAKYNKITEDIADIKIQMENLNSQKELAEHIYSSNENLKKSVKNLLDLVPDIITLHGIELDRNRLTIKGQTPTKDAYRLLMETPLKSVFSDTKTTFYQIKNGWYNFVSVNFLEEELYEDR